MTTVLVNLGFLVVLLLFIDWIVGFCNILGDDKVQTNYERKAEVACHVSFQNEERDVETMQDINKLLIENILPSTVAAKFLAPDRPVEVIVCIFHGNPF